MPLTHHPRHEIARTGALHGIAAFDRSKATGPFLMAPLCALNMQQHPQRSRISIYLLIRIQLKSGWELYSGKVFLQQLHFGDIVQPIITTHAGGVRGSLIGFTLVI